MDWLSGVIFAVCCSLCAAFGAGQTGTLPELVVSGKDSYWKTGTLSRLTSGTADIIVDESDKKQLWEGFGGTFNEMGWDALSVVSSEKTRALKLLFDANEGANFVYGRIPIGASDYAMSWYTLAETAGDYTMLKFSIARDRDKLIPFVKAALQIKPGLFLWASPWNVPSWMMSGNSMKSDAQTQGAHALYLARFVEEYGKEGLTIKAIHPQNEPGYAQVKWTQSVLISYFKTYLGPKFTERNVTAEIWCGTMSAPADSNIALAVARDSESMKYVKGFGMQWNHTGTVAALLPYRVWQTEHRCGNYDFEAPYWDRARYSTSKPQNDHLYAEESWQLIRDWIVGGVTMYSAWNMVLDTYGKSLGNWPQNALLVVDRTAKALIVTPAYYVFRHFSQYITPGATRIGTSGSNDVLAFRNPDGAIVVQIYNKENESKKLVVGVGSSLYGVEVPAHGWATFSAISGTPIGSRATNQSTQGRKLLKINYGAEGYHVALPSSGRESGRIELITLSGCVLESRVVPPGCCGVLFKRQVVGAGLLVVRAVYGGEAETALLCKIR